MTTWNVHGWEHLTGDEPGVVAFREELLRQLEEVPQPHRDGWEKRLKSKLDHPHFSVRLELYLHHFFKEQGWEIDIEPVLPGTSNTPDFRLRRNQHELLVEAKTLLDPQSVEKQDTRLKVLADEITTKLTRTVMIHPYFDLPPSIPNKRIRAAIEEKASESELLQEFHVAGDHQGRRYDLEVRVLFEDETEPGEGIGALMGQVHVVNTGQRMRKEIIEKARKYGRLNAPLVIALWPQTSLYHEDKHDFIALAGDEEWLLPADRFGGIASSRVIAERGIKSSFKPNGVFTLRNDGSTHRYSYVSAVAICQPVLDLAPSISERSPLRIYHNPNADYPVDIDEFRGVPQGIVNRSTGKMEWV